MISARGNDRISGILLIALAVSIVMFLATGIVDVAVESFSETFQGVADGQGTQYLALVVLHVSSVLVLVLAATLYLSFRHFEPVLALVGALGVAALSFTFIMSNVAGGAMVNIARELEMAPFQGEALLASARAMTMLQVFAWFFGAFTLLPLSLLTIGVIILRSRALPRWTGWLSIVSAVVIPTVWLSQPPFELEVFYLTALIGILGSLVWLVAVGVQLLARGTRKVAATP